MIRKILVILPLLALAILLWHNWPAPPSYIPEHLWGHWKTDHARYADRYLDISEAIFTIGQGERQLEVFFVQQVDQETVGARKRYRLHYTNANGDDHPPQTFSFFVEPSTDGLRLQLNNRQDVLWYREAAPNQALEEAARP